MEIKILQVFYGKDGLPYKDKDRQVHFPIAGTGFVGASNTTKIKFYYDELDDLNETTWVAVSKLPNGKLGSKVLESYLDEELNEHYALLELDNFYTQYKGDVFISLQGYQGGVNLDFDEETQQYEIHGTPTIAATGSIKFTNNYAPQFVGSGETQNINFQRILADLGTKLGIRATSEHVEELPTEGNPNIFYVVNDDPNDPNKANIYIWNSETRHYIWVGDNTLDLGDYYTKEQGQDFEEEINGRVSTVEGAIASVVSGSPAGTYATVDALTSADPDHSKIYLVTADGHWYYWNSTNNEWTDGGQYLSTGNAIEAKDIILYNQTKDLNSIMENCTYILQASSSSITNLPSDYALDGRISLLVTQYGEPTPSIKQYTQIIFDFANDCTYVRDCQSVDDGTTWTWHSWNKVKFVIPSNYMTEFQTLYTGRYAEDSVDLNTLTANSIYKFNVLGAGVTNLPQGYPLDGRLAFLFVNNLESGNNLVQILFDVTHLQYYFRYYYSGSWSTWTLYKNEEIICKDNTNLTFTDGYIINEDGSIEQNDGYSYSNFIEVEEGKKYYTSQYDEFLCFYTTNNLAQSNFTGRSPGWQNGVTIQSGVKYVVILTATFEKNIVKFSNLKQLTTSFIASQEKVDAYINAIDRLPSGIISFVSSQVPNGLPNLNYGGANLLITCRAKDVVDTNWDTQVVICLASSFKNFAMRRYYQGAWTAWEIAPNSDTEPLFEIGPGKTYTTLKAGFAAAHNVNNAKVIVYPGTYDLTQEFATELANHSGSGICIGKGMDITFLAGTYVTCLLDGSDSWAYSNFEPFYINGSEDSTFTLRGLNIKCSNTRYCVHDEASSAETPYYHRYIECHMEQINNVNPALFVQCIGGGLGEKGYISIEGGWYKSYTDYPITPSRFPDMTKDDWQEPISYHNGSSANCDGKIYIRDVYLADKGFFRFGYYGASTIKTNVEITNCSMYKDVWLMPETVDSANENFNIIKWNNEIRGS